MRGRLRPPPSKSLTQRYYNLALLAPGRTVVHQPLRSEDCAHFLAGLDAAGCRVDDGGESVAIERRDRPTAAAVHCGASGTMMRFLTASLAVIPGEWRLDGVPRLRERPQAPLLAALRSLGAEIRCLESEGLLPLAILGAPFSRQRVSIAAGESSQYVSALLMAGAASERGLILEVESLVSAPYVDLTLGALAEFGVEVEVADGRSRFAVPGGRLEAAGVTVEGDFSAACYPASAAALCGGTVMLEGVSRSSRQGDRAFFDLLADMGAIIDWLPDGVRVTGGGTLRAVNADLSAMPDQVPTLAALAPFAAGTTRIRNVAHLRLKESDRLAAMSAELRRLGATVEESEDGLVIEGTWGVGPPPQTPATVESHDDHRIAMSCALVGLRRPGVEVSTPQVVAKSYPDFWRDLEGLLG